MQRLIRGLSIFAAVLGILAATDWITTPKPVVGTHGEDGYRWDFHRQFVDVVHAQAAVGSIGPTNIPANLNITEHFFLGNGGRTEEVAGLDVEFTVKFLDRNVELHCEGGLATGYCGFGVRNNLLTASGLTRAGGAWLAHGSSNANIYGGRSVANAVSFVNAGADSTGMAIGTTTIDPLWFFVQTATGSEPRLDFAPTCSTLTDATPGNMKVISVPQGSVTGGLFVYTIYAFGGGVLQTTSGLTPFSAVNTAGTEVCGVGNTVGVDFLNVNGVGAGTLTAVAFTGVAGTDTCTYTASADSSIVGPTMAVCVTTFKNAGIGGIVTP